MARVDKTESAIGVVRAKLAGAWTGSATPKGFGIDVNGRAVPGAGQSGVIGVVCQPRSLAAGDIVDIITAGELVEFAGVAGTKYTALTTDGTISSAAVDATHVPIGWTVEATRLVLRCSAAIS